MDFISGVGGVLARPEETSPNWYVLLGGFEAPAAELTLGSGVTLRPLHAELTSSDLAGTLTAGFWEWATVGLFGEDWTCEIESAVDGDVFPGYNTLYRAWLATTLLVLRGYTETVAIACNSYSWSRIAGRAERRRAGGLPRFKGGLLDFQHVVFSGSDPRRGAPTAKDIAWIRDRFAVVDVLSSWPAFHLAMEAAVDWRFARNARSAIARLWTGIEAVTGLTAESLTKVPMLAAERLEADEGKRKARQRSLERLLLVRSKAIGGADLRDEVLEMGVQESFDLLRDLLVRSIKLGTVGRIERG